MPSPYKAKKLAEAEAKASAAPARPAAAAAEPAACPSLKALHESKAEAERAAGEKMAEGSPPLWSYQCPECGSWHLTSKPPRPSARARRRGAP